MINQKCAICEKENYQVVYPENFDIKKIDEKIFSARRLPDRVHYQIVKCKTCGLLFSTPILESKKIEQLYKKSFVAYDDQIGNITKTYGLYLNKLGEYFPKKGRILDIGCGNGFFLLEALRQGYKYVYGVEPGKKSVGSAPASIRKNIKIDVLRPGLFKKNFFDVICCFQTLDHIPNPNEFLAECYKILKNGGYVLFLNHDAQALTNKIMGESSPIIDIEHTYLFSKKNMRKIFEKHGFKVLKVDSAINIHYLGYWLHLAPLPKILKRWTLRLLKALGIDKLSLKLYAGNLVLFGQK